MDDNQPLFFLTDQFDNFLNNLNVYYNLALKSFNVQDKNKKGSDRLLKNSFLFSNSLGNYKILNSIAEVIREEINFSFSKDDPDLMMVFFKKAFLSYYEISPDLSNLFVILIYEFLQSIPKEIKNKISKEINVNKCSLLEVFRTEVEHKSQVLEFQDACEITLKGVVQKISDLNLKNLLKDFINDYLQSPINLLSSNPKFDYLYQFSSNAKTELFPNSQFFKLKRIKNICINEQIEKSNEISNFLLYDEFEFSENDELNMKITISKTNYRLMKMIQELISTVERLDITTMIILNDDVSHLYEYFNEFLEKNITLIKLHSESVDKFREIFFGCSINLFTYNYANGNVMLVEEVASNSITRSITLYKFSDFNNEYSYFIRVNDVQCSTTIVVTSSTQDYCKMLKGFTEKLIKMINLSKNNDFKYIKLDNLYDIIESILDRAKKESNCFYLHKYAEQIFLQYKIKRHMKNINHYVDSAKM